VSERIVSVIILAEDVRSANFLRRYVKHLGSRINQRQIRVDTCSHGSGEQYVRQKYPIEVAEQRRCVNGGFKSAALLVHIDADTETVSVEHRLLAKELKKTGQAPRESTEHIAIVVPRRHTETWLHGLCGTSVTEGQDCKRELKDHDSKIANAAKELFQLTRHNAPPPPQNLPALNPAILELRRLES
jgi:hypothetical protein